MQCSTSSSSPPETPQTGGDRAEFTQLPSKDVSFGGSTSELSSPKALTFDLLNMVISFKWMAFYLEPITDTVEVVRYLLGWESSFKTRSSNFPTTLCACPSLFIRTHHALLLQWQSWVTKSISEVFVLQIVTRLYSSHPVCVFRWRMPWCSLLSYILLNILFLTLSEGEM